MSINRLKFYLPRALRVGNAVLATTAASLVALHHWFPHFMVWLPVEVQAAVALVVFAFLADRILAVQQHLTPHVTAHATRELAYDHLLELVKRYGAARIDLLQFSGKTTMGFLQSVAAMGKYVEVRLFVVDDDQARRFDQSRVDYHLQRIKEAFNDLQLISEDHKNLKLQTFRYPGNAEVSAIVVDDFYASLGWNRSYIDENSRMIMKGHNTPAVNVISDRSLLNFAREQIKRAERFAVLCIGEGNQPAPMPLSPSQSPPQSPPPAPASSLPIPPLT